MNIIFSATRQWNPGDEFILRGCLRALALAGFDVNPVLFNRHPQIRRTNGIAALDRWLPRRNKSLFMDNSVKDMTDIAFADAVVFAGSPEWRGRRLRPLYAKLRASGRPALFLGIGTNKPFAFDAMHFSDDERAVLRASPLIACRDARTVQGLAPLPVHQLTCPAFLSVGCEAVHARVRRVALIFGSDTAIRQNNISPATFAFLGELYAALLARHGADIEFEFVAHYIDELPHFVRSAFAGWPLRYSYDSRDYADIYARYDLVVGHRVHGVGIAASQGIPGICITHDLRGETARGFGAELLAAGAPLEQGLRLFDEVRDSLEARSAGLIAHKREIESTYVDLLRGALRRA
ncbi:MAG: polysaccharide pyruvyl transferase family protein [Solimonas sp.]